MIEISESPMSGGPRGLLDKNPPVWKGAAERTAIEAGARTALAVDSTTQQKHLQYRNETRFVYSDSDSAGPRGPLVHFSVRRVEIFC